MLHECRCSECNKLLGKIEGRAEIVCTKCKALNKFNPTVREQSKMTKLYEVLNSLINEYKRMLVEGYKSPLYVGVKMHPRVFDEIMSDKDALHHVTLDLNIGAHKIDGYPIEITCAVNEYEIVALTMGGE